MHLIAKLIFYVISNAIALFAAHRLIEGFTLSGGLINLVLTALVLTAINTFIRPIIKLVLSPFILITLGLLIIAINAGLLFTLDILINPLTIQGLIPLLSSTILISIVNFILHLVAKPRG